MCHSAHGCRKHNNLEIDSENPSWFLYGPVHARLQPHPLPRIRGPRDDIVRIAYVGVCGNDVHFWKHGGVNRKVSKEKPLVLGHEGAGTIHAVITAVSSIQAGDPIAIEPSVPCRRCKTSKRGTYNLCQEMRFAAVPPNVHGTLTKYYRVPKDFVYKVPPEMSLQEAANLEPLSVAVHSTRLELIEVSLSYKFAVNQLDDHGDTPRSMMGASIYPSNSSLAPSLVAQARCDYRLMTLLFEKDLSSMGRHRSAQATLIKECMVSSVKDYDYKVNVKRLTGEEHIDLRVIKQAVAQIEVGFVMTLIGGHFVDERVRYVLYRIEGRQFKESIDTGYTRWQIEKDLEALGKELGIVKKRLYVLKSPNPLSILKNLDFFHHSHPA
ncbi:chaperonin 10-like protein [Aspergillus alliaceus]|uniref:chaperonin 10-like protein n=1 Tax=Petromyces alliaceus TaxID=209559 RepID=UPI0012A64A3A|nr:chaperonin 10-like protein [Aspergillus alliaceus]KAB8235916.1 chaperonin 10-like protein [Aspergillus alliaceus]